MILETVKTNSKGSWSLPNLVNSRKNIFTGAETLKPCLKEILEM